MKRPEFDLPRLHDAILVEASICHERRRGQAGDLALLDFYGPAPLDFETTKRLAMAGARIDLQRRRSRHEAKRQYPAR